VTFGAVALLGAVSAALSQAMAGTNMVPVALGRIAGVVNATCAGGELPTEASAQDVASAAASWAWRGVLGNVPFYMFKSE